MLWSVIGIVCLGTIIWAFFKFLASKPGAILVAGCFLGWVLLKSGFTQAFMDFLAGVPVDL